jgi:hypothetical protein
MKRRHCLQAATRLALVRWLAPIFVATALHGPSLADGYDFSAFPKTAATNHALGETADLKLGPNAAPWLPRFIEAQQAKLKTTRTPRQVALFRGDGATSYMAALWPGDTRRRHLNFYRIADANTDNAGLEPVRTLRPYSFAFDYPSGLRIFRGEPPVAVITIHWYAPSTFDDIHDTDRRLILMTGNTVDITPDWAGPVVDVVDIDDDGQYDVVTSDDRWEFFFYDGPRNPMLHLPVVLKRIDGDFVPACRQFAALYRKWIDSRLALARDRRKSPVFRAQALAGAMFSQVQIGALAEARQTATVLVDFIRKARRAPHRARDGEADRLNYDPDGLKDAFRRLLKRASRLKSLPCVLEAGPDGRYRRIERYRVLPD